MERKFKQENIFTNDEMDQTSYIHMSGDLPPSSKPVFSKTILFFTIMLTFGSHYCFDAPSVMEKQIQEEFHMSASKYHGLFVMNSWSHMVMGLLSGFLIDKFGNAKMAVFFAVLFVIGQTMFSLGAQFSSYTLMLVGRSVYSLGSGPIQIVQNAICARSFRYTGMAIAFGFVLTIGHIGSIINFIITPILVNQIGVVGTFWFADVLAFVSLICSIIFFFLDRHYSKFYWYRGTTEESVITRKVDWKQIKKLNFATFLVFALTAIYYSVIFPFNSISSKYFQVADGYSLEVSSWMAGIIYYTAFLFGPLFGLLIEKYSFRSLLSIVSFLLIIPAISLIFNTKITPIPWMILLGITYSIAPTVLWGSLPKLVPNQVIGTSMGLNACSQMLGVAITHIVLGQLKDHQSYREVYYYFLGIAVLGVMVAIVLNWNKGSVLNKPEEEKIVEEDREVVAPLL